MPLWELSDALAKGDVSAVELTERCLARINDPVGEGKLVFLKTSAAQALELAAAYDRLRGANVKVSRFAGIPISVKDLFDAAGEVTAAGSVALADSKPALRDATVIARLRAAGFVIIGRTNMTEFAYSGVGINPHYGTPKNPWDRRGGRIPGGSSSGAAVSVSDGMAYAGLGSDTGGSCRIPAALCGTVGWKPTASRVPMDGVLPLSFSLDSIGSMAHTVADCAVIDAVISGADIKRLATKDLSRLRFAAPTSLVLDGIDGDVGRAFEKALATLSSAGVEIDSMPLKELLEIPQLNAKGGLAASESFAWHEPLIEKHRALYDPRVLSRIMRGQLQTASDYIKLNAGRADLIARLSSSIFRDYDAVIMPTVPCIAPRIADLSSDDEFGKINALMLRNPSIANFLDLCSISLPMHESGAAPCGLMLMAQSGDDERLMSIAHSIESSAA